MNFQLYNKKYLKMGIVANIKSIKKFTDDEIKSYIEHNAKSINALVDNIYDSFKKTDSSMIGDKWYWYGRFDIELKFFNNLEDVIYQENTKKTDVYDYLDDESDNDDDDLEEEIYYQGGGKYKKEANCGQYPETDMELFMRGFVVAYPGENKIEKECDLFMTMKGM
jgi:hypothetical protein